MTGTKVKHTGVMGWYCKNCDPENAGITLVVEVDRPSALRAVEITCKKCAKRYRWESQGRWGVVGPWG
jgi:RNase P subunit RPR2